MPLTKDRIKTLMDEFRLNPKDTGSTSLQIALLTERITTLSEHLKKSPKDHASRHGLLKMVSQRRQLLNYFKKTDGDKYQKLIQRLDLRK